MPQFRKKPLVIEATQWFKHGDHPEVEPTTYMEVSTLMGGTSGCTNTEPNWDWSACGVIVTLEGLHVVTPGDWIIKGVGGEYHPCKDEIFQQSYESVEDTTSCFALVRGDYWAAFYVDGKKVAEGHEIPTSELFKLLGVSVQEIAAYECLDDADEFPDNLSDVQPDKESET